MYRAVCARGERRDNALGLVGWRAISKHVWVWRLTARCAAGLVRGEFAAEACRAVSDEIGTDGVA
jgi:hypothetical protein